MANVPATAKTPQDRKPKAEKPVAETGVDGDVFWFEYEGERYEFEPIAEDAVSPGMIRKNRNNPAEVTYTLLEQSAPKEALKLLDESWPVYRAVMPKFDDYASERLGAALGE